MRHYAYGEKHDLVKSLLNTPNVRFYDVFETLASSTQRFDLLWIAKIVYAVKQLVYLFFYLTVFTVTFDTNDREFSPMFLADCINLKLVPERNLKKGVVYHSNKFSLQENDLNPGVTYLD